MDNFDLEIKKSGEYIEESVRDGDDVEAVRIDEDVPFDFEEI